ncbi:unnamed protein product [Bemisia tabaci]|uniref:Uncharacterized protein n=2 Tax=Bemisia tabaci TaxID=7038 RepID=A0A9P0C7N3_BEMTA|nr:unnamed protein product [Bemisia tabaci]
MGDDFSSVSIDRTAERELSIGENPSLIPPSTGPFASSSPYNTSHDSSKILSSPPAKKTSPSSSKSPHESSPKVSRTSSRGHKQEDPIPTPYCLTPPEFRYANSQTPEPEASPRQSPSKSRTQSPTKSPPKTRSRSPTKTSPYKSQTQSPTKSPPETRSRSPTKTSPYKSRTQSPTKSPPETRSRSPTKTSPSKSQTQSPTISPPETRSRSPTKTYPSKPSPRSSFTAAELVASSEESPSESPVKPPFKTRTKSTSETPSTSPSNKHSARSPPRTPPGSPSQTPTDGTQWSPSLGAELSSALHRSLPKASLLGLPSSSPRTSPSASPSRQKASSVSPRWRPHNPTQNFEQDSKGNISSKRPPTPSQNSPVWRPPMEPKKEGEVCESPEKRLYDELHGKLMALFSKTDPPNSNDFYQLLDDFQDAKAAYEKKKTLSAKAEEIKVERGEEIPVWELVAAKRKCQELCDQIWGYAYIMNLPPWPEDRVTAWMQQIPSLDFFACGKLIPLTNGDSNDRPPPVPWPWPFGCDCRDDPAFIDLLNRYEIDAGFFSWFKSGDPEGTGTLRWLEREFVGKGLLHMTKDTLSETVRALFKKWGMPTAHWDMPAAQYEEVVRDQLGAEEVEVGDDYWNQAQYYRPPNPNPDDDAWLRNFLENMHKKSQNKET